MREPNTSEDKAYANMEEPEQTKPFCFNSVASAFQHRQTLLPTSTLYSKTVPLICGFLTDPLNPASPSSHAELEHFHPHTLQPLSTPSGIPGNIVD